MQPPQSTQNALAETDILAETDQIVSRHMTREGPLLPILHDMQDSFGHIPAAAIPRIADHLNLTRAEVHGVISFYHDFRDQPAGRHSLKICRSEACQAVGGAALSDHAKRRLGIDWHQTTEDGGITLEPIYCLGLCACGPAVLVDGDVVARVDADRLDTLIEGLSE